MLNLKIFSYFVNIKARSAKAKERDLSVGIKTWHEIIVKKNDSMVKSGSSWKPMLILWNTAKQLKNTRSVNFT